MERAHRRGFTLVELSIAVAIGALLILAVGAIAQGTGSSMDYLSRSHRVDRDLQKSLAAMTADLKHASLSGLVIDQSDPDHDMVTLQVPDPAVSGSLTWGYPDESGTFQIGWSGVYFVRDGDLVLRRVNYVGLEQGPDRVLCQNVDVAFPESNPEKGFTVIQNDELIALELRVHETFKDGRDYRRQERTVVHLINP